MNFHAAFVYKIFFIICGWTVADILLFGYFQIFPPVALALFDVQVMPVIALETGISVTEFLIVQTQKMNLLHNVVLVTRAKER